MCQGAPTSPRSLMLLCHQENGASHWWAATRPGTTSARPAVPQHAAAKALNRLMWSKRWSRGVAQSLRLAGRGRVGLGLPRPALQQAGEAVGHRLAWQRVLLSITFCGPSVAALPPVVVALAGIRLRRDHLPPAAFRGPRGLPAGAAVGGDAQRPRRRQRWRTRRSCVLLLASPRPSITIRPMIAMPMAALERDRMGIVDTRPAVSGHPPITAGSLFARYARSALWRELAYLLSFAIVGPLVYAALAGLASWTSRSSSAR